MKKYPNMITEITKLTAYIFSSSADFVKRSITRTTTDARNSLATDGNVYVYSKYPIIAIYLLIRKLFTWRKLIK